MAENEQNQGEDQSTANRGDFLTLMATFRGGRENTDMTKKLDKLARAVVASGKKGTFTLKITLSEDDDESGRLAVEMDSVIAPPRVPRTEYRYAKKNTGELVEENPETEAMLSRHIFDQGDN